MISCSSSSIGCELRASASAAAQRTQQRTRASSQEQGRACLSAGMYTNLNFCAMVAAAAQAAARGMSSRGRAAATGREYRHGKTVRWRRYSHKAARASSAGARRSAARAQRLRWRLSAQFRPRQPSCTRFAAPAGSLRRRLALRTRRAGELRACSAPRARADAPPRAFREEQQPSPAPRVASRSRLRSTTRATRRSASGRRVTRRRGSALRMQRADACCVWRCRAGPACVAACLRARGAGASGVLAPRRHLHAIHALARRRGRRR